MPTSLATRSSRSRPPPPRIFRVREQTWNAGPPTGGPTHGILAGLNGIYAHCGRHGCFSRPLHPNAFRAPGALAFCHGPFSMRSRALMAGRPLAAWVLSWAGRISSRWQSCSRNDWNRWEPRKRRRQQWRPLRRRSQGGGTHAVSGQGLLFRGWCRLLAPCRASEEMRGDLIP